VSLINKMLHDLDRRSGFVGPGGGAPLQQVRPLVQPSRLQLQFWVRGLVAVVVLAGGARIAWIANELRPRPALASDLAFCAEAEARARPAPVAAVAPVESRPAQTAPEPSNPESLPIIGAGDETAFPAAVDQPRAETLKLALSIDTPIPDRKPAIVRAAAPRRTLALAAPSLSPGAAEPSPVVSAPSATPVERHDRATTSAERAEAQFNTAVALLNQGRVAEAESALGGLLASNPLDERSRQALVALLLDQRRLEEAMLALRQGIALNPAQTQFHLVLARILAERRDYSGALEVLGRARPAGKSAEYSSLLGTVLQRLGRHREAAEAYGNALDASQGNAGALMGLAISLESLQERSDALEAYRRALAGGSLSPELRAYAEQKVKELR
jgi:MSHA biogenesis protein MshN